MRILVLSDSHGNVKNMCQAVERTQPDVIFHLGDYVRDGNALQMIFPDIAFLQVAGNCDAYDLSPAPLTHIYEYEGHRILLTHGHQFRVKYDLLALHYAAKEQNVSLAVFGHTHRAYEESSDGLTLLNPGSIGSTQSPSFAVIEIEGTRLKTAVLEL